MKRRTFLLPFVIFILLGCGSFNNHYHSTTLSATSAESTSVLSTNTATATRHREWAPGDRPQHGTIIEGAGEGEKHSRWLCPPFIMPKLPTRPLLPLDQLRRIKPSDVKAIDDLQQKHIEELRIHIRDVEKKIREAQEKQLEECKKVEQPR